MKLTTYAWIMVLVVFVGTLPHAVGAMFLRSQIYISQKSYLPKCDSTGYNLNSMKKLAKTIARGRVMAEYKSSYEWKSLFTLWNKESRWDYTASNKHSTAYGIPQMLNMKEDTPMTEQITLGLKYIKHRYGSPSKALAFHKHHGWY